MKILITSGATREPIDKVRFITNVSTGRTGAALADAMTDLKHEVTYLHGEGAVLPKASVAKVEFSSFEDLNEKIQKVMMEDQQDVVIHLAAVSDYSIDQISQEGKVLNLAGKLPSEGPLEIKLKPNFKILNRIKDYAKDYEPMVIGFKLTYTQDAHLQQVAIEKIFHEGNVDLVVHNDLKHIQDTNEHRFHVYNIFEKMSSVNGPQELARKLDQLMQEVL